MLKFALVVIALCSVHIYYSFGRLFEGIITIAASKGLCIRFGEIAPCGTNQWTGYYADVDFWRSHTWSEVGLLWCQQPLCHQFLPLSGRKRCTHTVCPSSPRTVHECISDETNFLRGPINNNNGHEMKQPCRCFEKKLDEQVKDVHHEPLAPAPIQMQNQNIPCSCDHLRKKPQNASH